MLSSLCCLDNWPTSWTLLVDQTADAIEHFIEKYHHFLIPNSFEVVLKIVGFSYSNSIFNSATVLLNIQHFYVIPELLMHTLLWVPFPEDWMELERCFRSRHVLYIYKTWISKLGIIGVHLSVWILVLAFHILQPSWYSTYLRYISINMYLRNNPFISAKFCWTQSILFLDPFC